MMGIKYLRVTAFRLGRPLIILIALGSNLGSHEAVSYTHLDVYKRQLLLCVQTGLHLF